MTPLARVRAVLAGRPTDRPAFALWRHFPGADRDADRLAAAELAFLAEYGYDLVKLNPPGMYFVEDRGVRWRYYGDHRTAPEVLAVPVHRPGDWAVLPPLEADRGALAVRRAAIAKVAAAVGETHPVLETVFTPLTVAAKLAGDRIVSLAEEGPDALEAALARFVEEIAAYVRLALAAGARGLFLANQMLQRAAFPPRLYARFGAPFDAALVERIRPQVEILALHVHGEDVDFDAAARLPADLLSWHCRSTPPSLTAARERTTRPFLAGLSRETLLRGSPADAAAQVRATLAEAGGRGVIVAPDCTVSPMAPPANLAAVRDAMRGGASSGGTR